MTDLDRLRRIAALLDAPVLGCGDPSDGGTSVCLRCGWTSCLAHSGSPHPCRTSQPEPADA